MEKIKLSRLQADLSLHFCERMQQIVADHFDTCRRAGLTPNATVAIIMKNIMTLSIHYAIRGGAGKGGFLSVLNQMWDEIEDLEEEIRVEEEIRREE